MYSRLICYFSPLLAEKALTSSCMATQVASYAYTFPDERDPDSQIRILLPMIDMINHADPERANIKVFRDDKGNYMAYATRPIKKGEEVSANQTFQLFACMS